MEIITAIFLLIGACTTTLIIVASIHGAIDAIKQKIENRRHKKQDPLRVLKCEINRMEPDPGAVLNPPSANLRKFMQEAYGVHIAHGATTEAIIRAIIVKELKGGEYDH